MIFLSVQRVMIRCCWVQIYFWKPATDLIFSHHSHVTQQRHVMRNSFFFFNFYKSTWCCKQHLPFSHNTSGSFPSTCIYTVSRKTCARVQLRFADLIQSAACPHHVFILWQQTLWQFDQQKSQWNLSTDTGCFYSHLNVHFILCVKCKMNVGGFYYCQIFVDTEMN